MIKVDETDPVGELAPTFPYRDVSIKRGVDMKEFYDLEGEIGRGKFGTVYRCREKGSSLHLAAKFVGIARRQDRKNVEREVEIMRALQHPRLIQLYDAFETDQVMCVILELIEGGELFERVIDDDFILTEKACTVFMRQICEGVAFIHSNNIIHLDLKPENILCLTKTGNRIKIIDFGLARKFEPDKKLQVLFGTPEFVAPEVVNFDQISCATDMWSVGVICYVLLSGLSPFMGETDVETMANVTVARYDFEDDSFDEISPEAKDFISKLLQKDKQARLTAVECLSHPWLRRQIPPPPPTLDTTKDNLRNYVEKYVPFIQTSLIVDQDLKPNKTGLIKQIIENEQKTMKSHCIASAKNDIPPIIDTLQGPNVLNTDHQLTNALSHHLPKNEKENLSSTGLGTKSVINIENIQENNRNSNILTNNLLPNLVIENINNNIDTDESNRISVPVNENIRKLNKKEGTPIICSKKVSTYCVNDKNLDNNENLSRTINPSFTFIPGDNSLKTKQENVFNESSSANIKTKETTGIQVEENSKSLKSKELKSETLDYHKNDVKKNVEKVLKVEENEAHSNVINIAKLQTKIHEESSSSCINTINIGHTVTAPSLSSQTTSIASSDFSLFSNKKDELFNKNHDNFIPEFMKGTIRNKASKECITSTLNEPKEPLKESNSHTHIFKQHLRSTPPWFSELSNQNSRKNSGDRFDRRSSDFSCFLNSKEDTESLNLADEIRKLSARLLQMSNNQSINQNQPVGTYNSNLGLSHSRNDPITCFLENHGIPHPRPKFKFSNLNRDVPIGSPPPPSNIAYYLNISSNNDKKDSRSAPESPRSSPEKNSSASHSSTCFKSNQCEMFRVSEMSKNNSQEKITSHSLLEQVHTNKTSKKSNFPV